MSVIDQIRSGAWLTAARMRAYGAIMLVFAAGGAVLWMALAKGMIDPNGKPLGTDFSSFYAAGRLALAGHATDAYDAAQHYAAEQRLFGPETPYYAWFYPPIFLLIAAPLALLPYPLALVAWQGGSLLLYLAAMAALLRRCAPTAPIRRTGLLLAAAFPAVFINLGHGQNGALTAGLFTLALLQLQARPMLAGLLFALMAYKPHFALVIPVTLIAARQWRCLAAATVTVLVLVAVTTALFGIDLWTLFAAVSAKSRMLLLDHSEVGFGKLQSTFAVVRLWGGGIALAYAAQAVVTAAVIASAAWSWRRAQDDELKAAILLLASLLASPLVLDYDLMLLGPAIAWLAMRGLRRGFAPFEASLLAAAWIVPLLTRTVAEACGLPLGWLVLIALYTTEIRRVAKDRTPVMAMAAPVAAA